MATEQDQEERRVLWTGVIIAGIVILAYLWAVYVFAAWHLPQFPNEGNPPSAVVITGPTHPGVTRTVIVPKPTPVTRIVTVPQPTTVIEQVPVTSVRTVTQTRTRVSVLPAVTKVILPLPTKLLPLPLPTPSLPVKLPHLGTPQVVLPGLITLPPIRLI